MRREETNRFWTEGLIRIRTERLAVRRLLIAIARYGVGYAGATVLAVVVVARVLPIDRAPLLFGVGLGALIVGAILLREPLTAGPGEALDALRVATSDGSTGDTTAGLDRGYVIGIIYTLSVFVCCWGVLFVPAYL